MIELTQDADAEPHAGRTGPLKFVVSMVGPSLEEARHIVEQVVSQVQGIIPDTLDSRRRW